MKNKLSDKNKVKNKLTTENTELHRRRIKKNFRALRAFRGSLVYGSLFKVQG